MKSLPYKNLSLTYIEYREMYIENYGRDKFNKALNAVIDSEKTKSLFNSSLSQGVAPNANDFFGLIFLIPYFIFAKNDTRLIGAIIALYIWNEKVNSNINLCNEKYFNYTISDLFRCFRM